MTHLLMIEKWQNELTWNELMDYGHLCEMEFFGQLIFNNYELLVFRTHNS